MVMPRIFYIVCLSMCCQFMSAGFIGTAFAQRGLGVSGKDRAYDNSTFYRKSWAVIIGIDKYKTWPRLEFAVHDAKGIKETLKKFGFNNFLELYNEEATKENILRVLGDEMGDPDKVEENDRVIVFFAGHGQTRALPQGRSLGYIIPIEANIENYHSTAISMTNLRDFCELIPAKHLLFVMDSCYSGLALATRGGTDPTMRNYIAEITRRRARQIITAGGADEEVADGGPNNHSVFTGFLIRGLEERLADMDGNGIITATELSAYLTPQVKSYSNQTPAFGSLLGNEGGDFLFIVPEKSSPGTGQKGLSVDEIAYKAAQSQNTIEGWENFLQNHPKSMYSEDASLSLRILGSEKSATELAEQARLAQEVEKKKVYLRQLADKAFQDARNTNTVKAWEAYLKSYPDDNSDHVNFAKHQIANLKKPQKHMLPTPVPTAIDTSKTYELFLDQPAVAFAGRPKEIKIDISGNKKLIKSAVLFYSGTRKSGFKSVKMGFSRSTLCGIIPKQALSSEKTIQYYIVVTNINGKTENIGSDAKPYTFMVKKPRGMSVAPVINF